MAVFRPRNRIEILRSMAARVVARSPLARLERNGAVFHILSSAATELAELNFQLARLRAMFSIDTATGSELDERAREIQPGVITRRLALFASAPVVFSRPGTVGNVVIPSGTIVGAQDAEGTIRYRTTAAVSILNGNTASASVSVTALEAGARANVGAGEISRFVTRVPGATTVTNPADIDTGRDRESDREFRARLKAWVRSLSRATSAALSGFALNVQLPDGRRVLFARVVEPAIPNGVVDLLIDDGTGTAETFSETYLLADDTLIDPALGGEDEAFTTNRPIRDDGTFQLFRNAAPQTRGLDYFLNPALGQIEIATPLSPGDVITARYRNYTGLIQQVQRVIDGDPSNPLRFPGVRGAGVATLVRSATVATQTLSASLSIADDFDVISTTTEVQSVIQQYINTLNIGEHVIVAEIIERAMGVEGVTNFRILNLSGSTPPVADQTILRTQVARISAGSITLT